MGNYGKTSRASNFSPEGADCPGEGEIRFQRMEKERRKGLGSRLGLPYGLISVGPGRGSWEGGSCDRHSTVKSDTQDTRILRHYRYIWLRQLLLRNNELFN